MALTARATEPVTWGEGIVPVLRKRLEHESRALSKRLSQTTTPDEVQPSSGQQRTSHVSHIPKPSIHSLSSEGAPRRTRPRTHSQPRLFDRDMLTPASSRSQSPAVPVANSRPSRIPTRPRAGSRSIPAAELPPSPDPSPDLWPVPENIIRTELTPPTPERSDHRRKRDTFVPPPPDDNEETLFDEPAPFTINSNSLAGRSSIDEYEHWYRGEGRAGGGRNGGRGEIRIATRTEMLEIASFGHPPSRNNSHGHGYGDFGWRNKAYDDSTIGTRFRWPDENGENVLDEAPLTDLDDMDTDSYHPGSQEARSIEVRSIESYQPPDVRSEHTMEDVRSVELEPEPDGRPDPVTPKPSRIARAVSPPIGSGASTASLVSRPGRSPTPSKALSTASKSPPPRAQSPKVKSPKVQPPKAQSPKPAQTPKAKSPARRTNTTTPKPPRAGTSQLTPKPGTPKTPRIGASPGRNNTSPSPRPRAQSTSTKSNGTRRTQKLSTGEDPGVHSLADAIPQIPPDQPNDGNWDDVVLPAIARKMQGGDVSLMGRELREVEEEPIPPAPGTFGYRERQKDKERKDQRRVSGTEMEEFGAREPVRKVKTVEKAEEKKKAEERAKAPSPPPFSDYTPIPPVIKPPEPVPAPVVQPMMISEADLRQNMSSKDSHDAGCCKCVVM